MESKTYLLFATLQCICLISYSQDERSPVHLGINAIGSVPSAAFKEAVDNKTEGMGIGVNANVLANPFGKRKYSPIYLGADLLYLNFGRDKIAATDLAPPYKTSYNYYGVSGIGRLLLTRRDGFTPFIDGMLGLKIFNARTKIDKDAYQTIIADEQAEVINNTTDTGLAYGIGVGFFNKRYSIASEGTGLGKASFSLRFMYAWGDDIRYVKRGSLQVDNGFVSFDKGYTRTDMLLIQLGVYIF